MDLEVDFCIFFNNFYYFQVISVHSLSTKTRTYSKPESSDASCIGLMEKQKSKAWPPHAFVNLATPSTSDLKATTLAK